MYVSAVNSLCILVCVATIVSRTTVFGSGHGNRTAEEVTAAAAVDARVEAGGHGATEASDQQNNKGTRSQEFQFLNPKPRKSTLARPRPSLAHVRAHTHARKLGYAETREVVGYRFHGFMWSHAKLANKGVLVGW